MAKPNTSTLSQLDAAVDALCSLSTELNAGTDKLNSVISSVTERLRAGGVGIEHWHDEFVHVVMIGPEGMEQFYGWKIGWWNPGKGNWQLSCQVGLYERSSGVDGDGNIKDFDKRLEMERAEADPRPLLGAPRPVRVGAIAKLPCLIAEITEKAKTGLAELDGVRDELESWEDANNKAPF